MKKKILLKENPFEMNTGYDEMMNEIETMSEILPYIYIGSMNDANNQTDLLKNGITHIICCIGDYTPAENYIDSDNILYIPLEDKSSQKLHSSIRVATEFINNELDKNKNSKFLIHCYQGISRSPAITAGYLITQYKMNPTECLDLIKSKRPCSNPNNGFIQQLLGMGNL